MATGVGPAPTPRWRVTRAPAGLPDSFPRGLSPAMLGRGVSPDKGRLEHCTCPFSSNPGAAHRDQLRRARGLNLRTGVATAREVSTLARTRPVSRARASQALQTYLERFSIHPRFRVTKRVERGPCYPLATAGGGRANARAFAQARRL